MHISNIKIVLDDEKIKKVLKIKDVIKVIEEGFRKKAQGLVSLPPKIGPELHTPGAFAEGMPVAVFKKERNGESAIRQYGERTKLEIFGIKWQSAYKSNLKKRIPYLNNLIILNEPKYGLPIAILKGNWITAMRTAGVSAVCAKYLVGASQRRAPTIGILGLGLQAYVHVIAFKSIFKNPRFVLFEYIHNELVAFQKKFPKEKFESTKNIHEVVKSSDVILSATTFPPKITPYIFNKDLKDDVLILPLEYGTRIDPNLYKYLDEIYTDDIAQYKLKSRDAPPGRLYFPPNRPKIKKEIGDIVFSNYKRSNIPKKILVFNLGIALFDILVADLFVKKTRKI
ncbi:MAG: hypothetical protein HYY52_02795 [Candidatus Melainabacteria bacterium]|nr:hypothetical protein [Candidatus Melainabacteria bacterium]